MDKVDNREDGWPRSAFLWGQQPVFPRVLSDPVGLCWSNEEDEPQAKSQLSSICSSEGSDSEGLESIRPYQEGKIKARWGWFVLKAQWSPCSGNRWNILPPACL